MCTLAEVVLVHVADDPHVGKIGNGEGGGAQALHAGRIGHLLIGNHAGGRRDNVHQSGRMVQIAAAQLELFGGGFNIYLGVVLSLFGDLQVVQGDGAVLVEVLRPIQLDARECLRREPLSGNPRSRRRYRHCEWSAGAAPSERCLRGAREFL